MKVSQRRTVCVAHCIQSPFQIYSICELKREVVHCMVYLKNRVCNKEAVGWRR